MRIKIVILLLKCNIFWADELDDAMTGLLSTLHVRGMSIAFMDRNHMTEPIVRGYGKVSNATDSPDVTPDTVFGLASVSKPFTGGAVLSMLDRGILSSLDDDICDVIPTSWKRSACRNPKYPDTPVTWRMIVTHRSSMIRDVPYFTDQYGDLVTAEYGPIGAYFGYARGGPCPLSDVIGFYRDFLTDKETQTTVGQGVIMQNGKPLNWYQVGQQAGGVWADYPPGARYVYSNVAVAYLAALIELATGQPFPNYTRQHIFEPLNMSRTAWFDNDLPPHTRRAVPQYYDNVSETFEEVGYYCYITYACCQLATSAIDMSKWLNAILDYGAPVLWSRTSGQIDLTCQEEDQTGQMVNDTACERDVNWQHMSNNMKASADYWLDPLLDVDWTNGVQQNGLEAGIRTLVLALPSAGIYMAVLTNTDNNDEDYAPMDVALQMFTTLGYTSTAVPSDIQTNYPSDMQQTTPPPIENKTMLPPSDTIVVSVSASSMRSSSLWPISLFLLWKFGLSVRM